MLTKPLGYWLARGALLLAAPAMLGSLGPSEAFSARVLATHNRERAEFGIAPMRWNPALAADAQKWANYLARTGRFEHSPEDPTDPDPQGENLWAGTRAYFSPEAMVDAWIREKKYFVPGMFPQNSMTGRVEDVGHFTQVVWRDSGEVGCAKATDTDEDILVCRYAHAGNWVGEHPF
jgi:hypothetical protein